jgi:ferrous iron transport protein B
MTRILLVGYPNSGKTTLFNRLCGLRAKTANFPGTTTSLRVGRLQPGRDGAPSSPIEVVDLPGLYDLKLSLPEVEVVRQALSGWDGVAPAGAILVVDATHLRRQLRLALELLARGIPTLLAVNMMDLARRKGLSYDLTRLEENLGLPVVAVSARKGEGIAALVAKIAQLQQGGVVVPPLEPALLEDPEAWAERLALDCLGGPHAVGSPADRFVDRLDRTFTHPVLGFAIFVAVMGALFWTIFALASVPMELIEATFAHVGQALEQWLPAGAVRDLLVGGLIGGISGTVVFVPQIALLFFLISLLEDTGYLARAAFVMDRLLYRFGLPGNAFVPLLSSHACAIPGIVATRLIPDPSDRLATILVAPLMSCSARLPVYVLLTGFLFPSSPAKAGFAFAACYFLGASAALGAAKLLRKTLLPGQARPMVLELPSYKWPDVRVAASLAFTESWGFLRTVGTTILALSFLIWWLSAFPKSDPGPEVQELQQRGAQLATSDAAGAASLEKEAALLLRRQQQEASFAGRLGKWIEPAFAPLGLDWKLSVGVLTSFAAREVFVATLAVLVGAPDEDLKLGVLERIHQARRSDGTPLLTPASASSLLVFFVLAMQCVSTLATVTRETRSLRWPLFQLFGMTGVAWLAAFFTYRVLLLLGIS